MASARPPRLPCCDVVQETLELVPSTLPRNHLPEQLPLRMRQLPRVRRPTSEYWRHPRQNRCVLRSAAHSCRRNRAESSKIHLPPNVRQNRWFVRYCQGFSDRPNQKFSGFGPMFQHELIERCDPNQQNREGQSFGSKSRKENSKPDPAECLIGELRYRIKVAGRNRVLFTPFYRQELRASSSSRLRQQFSPHGRGSEPLSPPPGYGDHCGDASKDGSLRVVDPGWPFEMGRHRNNPPGHARRYEQESHRDNSAPPPRGADNRSFFPPPRSKK